MSYYEARDFDVETKTDNSPVTSADRASNDYILENLSLLFPATPVISEETTKVPYEQRINWEYSWMLDPLDGTKEFIKHNGEFSINLALIKNQKPIAGLIHFPVQKWTYYAIQGKGAFKKTTDSLVPIPQPPISDPQAPIHIMISRSHAGPKEHAFIEKVKKAGFAVKTHPHGSAMKHALIAEGVGDIYPKFGICSEWDTAPGQIILEEAGGRISSLDNGKALLYNKPSFENPAFIMWGPGISEDSRIKIEQQVQHT